MPKELLEETIKRPPPPGNLSSALEFLWHFFLNKQESLPTLSQLQSITMVVICDSWPWSDLCTRTFRVLSKVMEFVLNERTAAPSGKQINKSPTSLPYRMMPIMWFTRGHFHSTFSCNCAVCADVGYYLSPQLKTKKKALSTPVGKWCSVWREHAWNSWGWLVWVCFMQQAGPWKFKM